MTTSARISYVIMAALVLPFAAFAKRMPPPVVNPVVHEGVRYTIPNDKGTVGYVVAWDATTGKQMWKQTIFRKCIFPLVEHDVQWVFTKEMRLAGGKLLITNERNKVYSLDLKTRKVKKLRRQP